MPARPSEIRAFLARYAGKRRIIITEYTSDPGEGEGPVYYYCHLQSSGDDPKRTATAVSKNGMDDALVMAFLSYADSSLNFLDDEL